MSDFIYNPPKEPYLDIIYDDDDIVVVNKPSGILSVPGKAVEHYDSILARVREKAPLAQAVHRLDMATSGVLLVAKKKEASGKIGKQFQERKTKKIYYAWVGGVPEKSEGVINLPLRTDIDNRPYQIVDWKNGREAITQYIVMYSAPVKNISFIRLHPMTGRSHQLRVHLKEIGHPILGDELYATPEIRSMAPHLYLHAWELNVCHPRSMQKMKFVAPPPFDVPVPLY